MSSGSSLAAGRRSCSSGAGMGSNREQFLSWWAEKSIRKSEHDLLRAHTLWGSMPGAEDGREAPSPGGP